jgi:hypothetical protein
MGPGNLSHRDRPYPRPSERRRSAFGARSFGYMTDSLIEQSGDPGIHRPDMNLTGTWPTSRSGDGAEMICSS